MLLAPLGLFMLLKWHRREVFWQVHRVCYSSCIVKDLECKALVCLKRVISVASQSLQCVAVCFACVLDDLVSLVVQWNQRYPKVLNYELECG